jgi:Fe-S-cluster containining protein
MEKNGVSTGRNNPCPCGSGLKYKKCCQLHELEPGYISLNNRFISVKQTAYAGAAGKQREQSAIKYLEQKKVGIREVEESQKEQARFNNETISCHRGCNYCCYVFTEATLPEYEGIVYYLYQHEDIFNAFIRGYPTWRMKVQKVAKSFDQLSKLDNKTEFVRQLKTALREYHVQNVPCPFLMDGACSIHEVRPWVCVGVVSVIPSEWCNFKNPNYARTKYYSSDLLRTKEAGFSKPTRINSLSSSMPATIFRILKNGYAGFYNQLEY